MQAVLCCVVDVLMCWQQMFRNVQSIWIYRQLNGHLASQRVAFGFGMFITCIVFELMLIGWKQALLGHVRNLGAITLADSVGMWPKLDTSKFSNITSISLDAHNKISITGMVLSEVWYNMYNVAHFYALVIADLARWILRNRTVFMVSDSLSELVRYNRLVINVYLMVWELIPLE